MIQEVLQRKQDPWQWGVQCSAAGCSQQQIERIIEADPLTTTQEVAEELSMDHSMVIWHLKQIGKVKSLVSGYLTYLVADCKSKKIVILKCHLNSTQLQQTISWSDYNMWQKVDLYKATTSSAAGSRRSRKSLPKAKLEPKNVMVTGGLLPIWFTVTFCCCCCKSLQSCLTLCDPIPGILQARTLEWVAISFSSA